MATDLERLVVQLSADVRGYENALNRAMGVTNRQARSIESRFKKMNSVVSSTVSGIATGAAKAFALIGGAQGFRQLSDSATRIDNSLKVAGLSGEALEGVYQKLFAAAQKNAAPLETLVQLYGRVSLVQNELGVSSDQIINLSNNVALALRASGQSSEEASGALLQLSQALGAGVVRAEEFNSIQEGAPTILQAAAAGIEQAGGSVAKLRQIMLDGNLSSKAFFDGINAGAPVLEQKVAGAVLAIDQRLENLRTALTNAAREFNASTHAANTFGSAIDNVTAFVNSVDMDGLAADIGAIIGLLNSGAAAANNFAVELGKLSGLANIGQGIISALDSDGDGKLSALGGALTVESTVKGSEKIVNNTQKRLDLERQIAEIKSNPANVLGGAEIRMLEGQLKDLQVSAAKTASTVIQDTLNKTPLKYPKAAPDLGVSAPVAAASGGAKFTPIDITDPKYKPPVSASSGGRGAKGGGGGRSRASDYEREVQQIQQRTAALQAETQAQAGLNPLINDYGFAVEYASAKQDLLNAAKEAGLTITPELEANIDALAKAYGNASVESERLAESQDKIKQAAEDFKNTAKDITSGFISDLRSGTSAAQALSNALNKVLDKVIDIGLNSIFGTGGAGGGLFGGLLSFLGLKNGGVVHAATGGRIRGPGTGRSDSIPAMLSNGEFVVNAAATKKYAGLLEAINSGSAIKLANGGYANPSMRAPALPSLAGSSLARKNNETVTVLLRDDSGRMASIADQRIQTSSGTIVKVAVQQSTQRVVPTMASYQKDKAGAEWR